MNITPKAYATSDEIIWGIVGCGNVTEVKSGPAFNKVPHSRLWAVMRRDAKKAKDYAERHNVPVWYDDANELLGDPKINAVYIATPPRYHEEYCLAALSAGKAVYVEKPMSTTVEACDRMINAANKAGLPLCIAHYRRALPMFLHIKGLVDSKQIGEIRTIRISLLKKDRSVEIPPADNWRVKPEMAGGGLFYDLAPHQLDLVHFFFGEATHITGMAENQANLYQAEDIVIGTMKLQNKALFEGRWCFTVADGLQEDVFEIIGSIGKISFPVFGNKVTMNVHGIETETIFQHPQHIQQPLIEKIVAHFLGRGDNPCSGTDALLSMKTMQRFVYG